MKDGKATIEGLGFSVITPIMEIQMEKEVKNAKETWFSYRAKITYLWLAGNEGMESNMEHIFFTGLYRDNYTIYFIPC